MYIVDFIYCVFIWNFLRDFKMMPHVGTSSLRKYIIIIISLFPFQTSMNVQGTSTNVIIMPTVLTLMGHIIVLVMTDMTEMDSTALVTRKYLSYCSISSGRLCDIIFILQVQMNLVGYNCHYFSFRHR